MYFTAVTRISLDIEAKTHIEMECTRHSTRISRVEFYRLLDFY